MSVKVLRTGTSGRWTASIYTVTVVVLLGVTIGTVLASAFAATPVSSSAASGATAGLGAQDVPLLSQAPFVQLFPVTFTAVGLPSGTAWWVNTTNGVSVNSSGPTLQIYEPKGTYHYTVSSAHNEYAARHGTVVVKNGPASRAVKFKLVSYKVLVSETGLPSGSKWCVLMSGGATHCSKRATFSFREPNGTYVYDVTTTQTGYADPSGSFTVGGATASVTATFEKVRVMCPMCG